MIASGFLFANTMNDIKELPIEKDLCVRRGEDFSINLFWKPGGLTADLTNYRAKIEIRDAFTNVVIETLSTDLDGFQEIKTGLFTDGVNQWNIEIFLPAARTKLMGINTYKYDLLLINPSPSVASKFLLKGDFSVLQEVTVNSYV